MDWHWLAFILVGLAVGGLSGFFGVGGGVLLVPMLVFIMGFTQKEAQGTSLAVLSVPVVIFAAMEYHRRGYVHLNAVLWIIMGFIIGSYIAARLVDGISPGWLQRGFGMLLLYVGVVFLFSEEKRSKAMLPAAVAAAVAWLASFLWRRRRKSLPPPTGPEPEWHI